jgi:hypothetical protein
LEGHLERSGFETMSTAAEVLFAAALGEPWPSNSTKLSLYPMGALRFLHAGSIEIDVSVKETYHDPCMVTHAAVPLVLNFISSGAM